MKSHLFLALAFVAIANRGSAAATPIPVPISSLGSDFKLIGKLNHPLGETIAIVGVAVQGPSKGYEDGLNLRIQSVAGVATQQDLQILLTPYCGDWDDESEEDAPPKRGKTYELLGFETGGYLGTPVEAFRQAPVTMQTTGFYFRTDFVVLRAKRADPVAFAPAQFVGREALLQGTARTKVNRAVMEGRDWTVVIDPMTKWPDGIEGKSIEALGRFEPEDERQSFRLASGTWHLVRLEDQLNRQVELRGRAISLNGTWWLRYRGTDLYVDNMGGLPGWTADNHYRPVLIRGTLDQAMLPRLDQITQKKDPDLRQCYIVRNASWESLNELLSPEIPINDEAD